jgi:hypothetical protein
MRKVPYYKGDRARGSRAGSDAEFCTEAAMTDRLRRVMMLYWHSGIRLNQACVKWLVMSLRDSNSFEARFPFSGMHGRDDLRDLLNRLLCYKSPAIF